MWWERKTGSHKITLTNSQQHSIVLSALTAHKHAYTVKSWSNSKYHGIELHYKNRFKRQIKDCFKLNKVKIISRKKQNNKESEHFQQYLKGLCIEFRNPCY